MAREAELQPDAEGLSAAQRLAGQPLLHPRVHRPQDQGEESSEDYERGDTPLQALTGQGCRVDIYCVNRRNGSEGQRLLPAVLLLMAHLALSKQLSKRENKWLC